MKRLLNPGDEDLLEAFLSKHRDTSMFLRSNVRRAGLMFRPEPFHATYVCSVEDNHISGVVAHGWNGMIIVQAPEGAGELAVECVRLSSRPVTGLTGPLEQVKQVRGALSLTSVPARMEADEWLYGLDLSDLIIPAALSRGQLLWRQPLEEELPTLQDWRFHYEVETLGSPDSEETRRRAAKSLDAQVAEGNAWIAVEENRPVSLSAFNAALPDIVQLGGIYTPPALRGRGYAKAAVAGSLIAGRARGAFRAVLFTDNPSAARSYEAVGFRRLGDYGLVLLNA